MVSTTNNCVTSGLGTPAEIKAGVKVTINVKENTPYDFYVTSDDGNKVTLIMSENLGNNVKWYADKNNNSYGSITALSALASRTSNWTNISEKTYTVSGLGHDGQTKKYEDIEYTGRARLITYEEVTSDNVGCTTDFRSCPTWMYTNLRNTGSDTDSLGSNREGYWTSTAHATSSLNVAFKISHIGYADDAWSTDGLTGLRPVIELSK